MVLPSLINIVDPGFPYTSIMRYPSLYPTIARISLSQLNTISQETLQWSTNSHYEGLHREQLQMKFVFKQTHIRGICEGSQSENRHKLRTEVHSQVLFAEPLLAKRSLSWVHWAYWRTVELWLREIELGLWLDRETKLVGTV